MTSARPSRDPAREPLWTASFILFSLANVAVSAVFYLLVPTMAPFATEAFGADPGQAGLAASIFFFGAVAMRFVAGGIVGKLGLKRSVVLSLAAGALSVAAYLVVGSLIALYVVRFVHGCVFAIVQTALTSTVMSSIPVLRRGEGAGWFTAGLAVMTGLGPAIGFELLSRAGMTWVFVAAVAASLGAFALAGAGVALMKVDVSRAQPATAGGGGPGSRPSRLSRLLAPEAFSVGIVVACAAVAFACVISFFASHVQEAGLEAAVGPYFLAYAAASFVSRPVAGPIQDRRGDAAIFVPALISVVIGTLLTALATSVPVIVLGGALLGGGYGTLMSAGQASAVNRAGAGRSAQAVSSFFLCVDAATGLAPAVLGVFGGALGYPAIFIAGAVTSLIGLIVFVLGPGRSGRPGFARQA
ncbi:MAG: MFS transporter [Dermatophilus congolensis]|nr:MFS transporter [Dermatophilus congolensis]